MAAICRTCKKVKELHEFVKHNQHKNGYDTKCKKCHIQYNKRYTIGRRKENQKNKVKIILEYKECNKCYTNQPIKNFSKVFSSKDCYRNTCSACESKRRYELGEDRLRYRANNVDQIKCLHCDEIFKLNHYSFSELKRKNPSCSSCVTTKNNIWRDKKSISNQCIITRKEYDDLLHSQNYVCAICHEPERRMIRGKVARLCVDHCHNSQGKGINKIRGLLCSACNQSLGLMRDSSVFLRNAADYLDCNND